MSHQTSPGPSHSHPHSQSHNFQQTTPPSSRQKTKPYSIGIAAGAEDVKYQAKYKELKRKVKEIEADNDKLHFKVLQAKRSIQRMKLERAILYERLSAVSPSPDIHDRHALPPIHSAPGISSYQPPPHDISGHHQPRDNRDHPSTNELDHNLVDYIRTYGNPPVIPGPDGRPVPVMDIPMGPGVTPSSHGLSAHPKRSSSASGHDSSRQLPPLPYLPPVVPPETRGHAYSQMHSSPHPGSHEHTRSHTSSRSRSHQVPPQSYPSYPPQYHEHSPRAQHVLHSPPPSERDMPRRQDIHELVSAHSDLHGHSRHQTPLGPHSPHLHPVDTRSSGRMHNQQSTGQITYINKDDRHERERELEREREREWDRNRDVGRGREMSSTRMHSPPPIHRSHQPMDRDRVDHREPHSSRIREEPYYQDVPGPAGYPMQSRSGSPISGSGSVSGIGVVDGPSRPDSRSQFYDHDRPRSYKLRPVNQPNDDIDFVHEDGRSQPRDRGGGGGAFTSEQNRPPAESRKRSRTDMEIDGDDATDVTGGAERAVYALPEDRGSKRYHRDHPVRNVDGQEDDRIGP